MRLVRKKLCFSKELGRKIAKAIGESYVVEQYVNDLYTREYDTYRLKGIMGEIVLKSSSNPNESLVYEILTRETLDFLPSIRFCAKDGQMYWLAMDEIVSNHESFSQDNYKRLVANLASVHAKEYSGLSQIKQTNYYELNDIKKIESRIISEEDCQLIALSFQRLKDSYQTLVHGDMIPLNMLVEEEQVMIIDWECGKQGSYILDLGRLLGDYNIDKPWVKKEWHESIANCYYQTLIDYGMDISFSDFLCDCSCAKMYNYFGIVYAFKTREWEETPWFHLNVRLLKEAINEYRERR